MNKVFGIIFILSITVSSCSYDESYHTITKEHQFSISLPGWVKEEKLAADAQMSYANRYRNFYVAIFAEDKKTPFDTFQHRVTQRIVSSLDSSTVTSKQISYANINGAEYHIFGKMGEESERIYYTIRTIEASKKFYQICIWTRGKNRDEKYKEDIQKIVGSFKEL
jgi:hypothetical protein